MKNSTNPKHNYSTNYNISQLVLPLDFSLMLKENDPVFSFSEVMNRVALLDLEKEVKKLGRSPYDFSMMCRLIAFSYMQNIFSLRKIEYACVHDIRFWLLTNGATPSHKTIGEFIKYRLGSNIKILFRRIVEVLEEMDDIDMSTAFLDGTKFEANANKYTFVWKKAVLKYLDRMQNRISESIEKLNDHVLLKYGKEFEVKEKYRPEDLLEIMDWLLYIAEQENIEFREHSSRKKHPIQRLYNEFYEYERRMMDYFEKLEICGERNSYSKTDHDATFLHLKEDYYGGTNLFHAAYNVQIMVSDEYITHIGVYQNPTDVKTFIPFMDEYKEAYGELPIRTVADAGYGSYDNYMYCIENGIRLTQKFSTYSIEKTSKYRKKIFNKDNWYRDEATGDYICPNFKRFRIIGEKRSKKGGYLRIDQIHGCGDKCIFCPMHGECTKSSKGRTIVVNPILDEMKEEVRKQLGSEEGKELKKRRSAEVEGAFGIIKNNYGYERIHRKGKENVEIEMYLIGIGFNLRKYHHRKLRKIKVELFN